MLGPQILKSTMCFTGKSPDLSRLGITQVRDNKQLRHREWPDGFPATTTTAGLAIHAW